MHLIIQVLLRKEITRFGNSLHEINTGHSKVINSRNGVSDRVIEFQYTFFSTLGTVLGCSDEYLLNL